MSFGPKKVKKVGVKLLSSNMLNRKYSGSGLASELIVEPEDRLWIPSKNLYLNYTLGGGVSYGKICEIFGNESSGKSLVAMDFGTTTQSLGGIVLWNDAEQAFDPYWARKNGLDLKRIVLYSEISIERISDWSADMALSWRSKLTNNEPILLVVDSTAALDCEANIDSAQMDAKAEMGNRAKALYKMLRIRNPLYAELGVTPIFINQLRKKVGASKFEDPDTTPGGEAMRFFASQRLAFFQKKQIKEVVNGKECWVGNEVGVRLKKNKLAPPRPSFITEIYFHEEYGKIGFEKYSNLPELLERAGAIVSKKGGMYYLKEEDGLTKICRGEEELQSMLIRDSELRAKCLSIAKINTLSKTRKKLKELNEQGINRYKVKTKVVKKQLEDTSEDDEIE